MNKIRIQSMIKIEIGPTGPVLNLTLDLNLNLINPI